MAEIVLNVEVRNGAGTGAAREVRRQGKIPGVLYGGVRGPVPVAVEANAFRKALYTGKLLGHLVTLKHGDETQPVITKDVQFDPVSDQPIHFDLYRVEEHQQIKIAVPVHFKNQDVSPGLKRGGALNIAWHELEIWAFADQIPEELVADVGALDIGGTVHVSDLLLPEGVKAVGAGDVVVATVTGSSAQASEEAAAEGEAATEA
jgi:large subunit ribosomal protein L25